MRHAVHAPLLVLTLSVTCVSLAEATPQFARQYRVDCSHCHAGPPRLNEQGEDFLARHYRFTEGPRLSGWRTIPVAVWNTFDLEHRDSSGVTKAFPGRVELISAGPIGRTRFGYFVEWRVVSQQVSGNGRLLNRSGRFEDAFVIFPLGLQGAVNLTVGQFRALDQIDVSRRLSLSEPAAFSASLPSPRPTTSPRLASVRAFSPSGRQPGIRLQYQHPGARRAAEGWHASMVLPLGGELTIPFADGASFELEARAKGVFLESYYRHGLSSAGGHVFVGNQRRLATGVVRAELGRRLSMLTALGRENALGAAATRLSIGTEFTVNEHVVTGFRVDHRTGAQRRPALLLIANGHLPFGPAGARQALRLQFEQRVQHGNYITALGLSHVF